jgi:diadenylate cyclase
VEWLTGSWMFREVIVPALDVLILGFLLYRTYLILVQTRAIQLVKGAMTIALIYLLAFFLRLETLLWILNALVPGLVIAVAIVFQPELRRIFTRIGQREWFRLAPRVRSYHLEAVLNAVEIFSVQKVGAILVFARNIGLGPIVETGTRLNGEVSSSLILTIFTDGTPLHDGAVVIQDDRILAAGCFLPLSEQPDIRRSFGTRHRAALGLAEETDAVVLVVSEENGAVSLAYDANLLYDLSLEEVSTRLKSLLTLREEKVEETPELE